MPAFVNSKVGSPCGTSELLRTRRCPFSSKKRRNISRISLPDSFLISRPVTKSSILAKKLSSEYRRPARDAPIRPPLLSPISVTPYRSVHQLLLSSYWSLVAGHWSPVTSPALAAPLSSRAARLGKPSPSLPENPLRSRPEYSQTSAGSGPPAETTCSESAP